MKLSEILEKLTEISESSELSLSPGPFSIRVNESDARAAGVLMILINEGFSVGEIEDVLLNALFWLRWIASVLLPTLNDDATQAHPEGQ